MKSDLNLLESYRIINRRSGSKSNVLYTVIALIVIMVGLIIAATSVLLLLNLKDNNTINALNAEIITLKQDASKVEIVRKELSQVDNLKTAFTSVNNEISADRMMSKKDVATIFGAIANDVTIENISYTRARMILTCKTTNKHSPSLSAEQLNKQGITTIVQYTGFDSKENKVPISDKAEIAEGAITYSFTITCIITPEQGGEAA